MHCFSFDIETIPDVEFGRRMYGLEDLSDADVGTAMTFMRQQQTGSDFLPLHVQRVVAISVAFRSGDGFRVWTLGDRDADEAEIIRRFFEGIEKYSPELVSWNGSGFDLPDNLAVVYQVFFIFWMNRLQVCMPKIISI